MYMLVSFDDLFLRLTVFFNYQTHFVIIYKLQKKTFL